MVDRALQTDILAAFNKAKAEGEAVARPIRRVAQLNEDFCAGRQFGAYNQRLNIVVQDQWENGLPRIYVNLLSNKMTAFSALLNRDRRTALATPTTADNPEDVYTAEIANRFIDYFISEQKTAAKVHEAVQFSFLNGTGGIKHFYDADADEIRWSRLTVHDYLIDPRQEDWRLAKWVIFESQYDEDLVADMWAKAKHKGDPPAAQEYRNSAGQTVSGVLGHEFWQRPTHKFPKGFFACVINNEIVELKDYPNAIEAEGGRVEYFLPLSLMKLRAERGSVYGQTPLTDCLPLQRSYNEMVSRTLKLARTVTNPQLIAPKSVAEQVNFSKNQVIAYDSDVSDPGAIKWTDPGRIAPELFTLRDDFNDSINEVVGLNEVTSGQSTPSISGRAIEGYYEIDSQKNSDALKNLDDMVLDCWRATLGLVQIHYPVQRQSKIVRQTEADLVTFSAADLAGANIRLEADSELARRTDVKTAVAVEQAAAGVGGQAEVDTARKTAGSALAKRWALTAVRAFVEGDDISVNAAEHSLPALQAAIDREKSRALSNGKRSDFVSLMQLEQLIKREFEEVDDVDVAAPATPTDNITMPEPRA